MWNQKVLAKYVALVGSALAGTVGWLGLHSRQSAPHHIGATSAVITPRKVPGVADRAHAAAAYGKLPLRFEANQGQSGRVGFLSRGRGYTLFLMPSEAVLALNKGSKSLGTDALRMRFLGANTGAAATAMEQLPGVTNYFIGNDPRKWRTEVPTYSKVRYRDIYSGVDLLYYGNQQQLEYDLVVNPGADPRVATLGISGATQIQLDRDGDLALETRGGAVRWRKPVAYQQTAKGRQPIDAHYTLRGDNQVAFAVGSYDRTKPLVIDPILVYSTYFGGSATEVINYNTPGNYFSGIAVDAAGSVYVTGSTESADFPTAGAFQPSFSGGQYDAFVTKFKPDGSALVYSTFLGGSGQDNGGGIAVDSSGNAYITGETASTDFPTTHGAFQVSKVSGGIDPAAFVTKLDASGSALVYSTYLGGSSSDWATGIAVDSSGRASVTGQANSANFPLKGAPQGTSGAAPDAFVTTVTADGTSLVFSTYLGGKAEDSGNAIALDSSGNIYVTGMTASSNFPTVNPLQPALAGSWNVFVAKLNPDTAELIYSTFLGGGAFDEGLGIAVDSSGSAYVTGFTESSDYPTVNPFQAALPGAAFTTKAAFVSKLNPAGSALLYSTYLGGGDSTNNQGDFAIGIAVDSIGAAYVTGSTNSGKFPSVNALEPYKGNAPFVAKFTPDGSTLAYSTFFAGLGMGSAIAVDASSNAYVTGTTNSPTFVTTPEALQTTLGGVEDGFVVKISGDKTLTNASSSRTPSVFGQEITFTVTVTSALANANTPSGTVSFKDGTTPLGSATLANGTATFSVSTLSTGSHSIAVIYDGDAYFASSASTVGQLVNQAATTITQTDSPRPSAAGQSVTLTATVAAVSPGAGTPTGTVTFTDTSQGNATLGTGTLNSGVATLSISTLAVGTHNLAASYGGDSNFTASTSAAIDQVVAESTVSIPISESVTISFTPYVVAAPASVSFLVPESVTVGATYTIGLDPCDLKKNAIIDVSDVQAIVNQVLGTSPPTNDLTGDGVVNVLDVQIEINSAIGLACLVAQ
jgi:hypothetical protein